MESDIVINIWGDIPYKKIKQSIEDGLFSKENKHIDIVDYIVDGIAENIKDDVIDDLKNELIAEGVEENKLQVAKDMIKEGYSNEEILKISRLTEEQYLSLL